VERPDLVIDADSVLADRVDALAGARIVFFAGLPGTGKSFLVHQVAHLASARGRVVHLLQWDVARPVFEASDAGRRYPVREGVTHVVVRRAAGLWARHAVAAWHARYGNSIRDLLLGETPFVGNRFLELARRMDDAAEPLLRDPACRFAIPVPSTPVRTFLEAERARRAARPLHPREREEAPPTVLRLLWREVVGVAAALGLPAAAPGARPTPSPEASAAPVASPAPAIGRPGAGGAGPCGPPWDPELYRGVYQALLRHRHADVVPIDTVFRTSSMSVYRFSVAPRDVVPAVQEAGRFIAEVERRYPSVADLEREVERWWAV
jgi:hypothetical protein